MSTGAAAILPGSPSGRGAGDQYSKTLAYKNPSCVTTQRVQSKKQGKNRGNNSEINKTTRRIQEDLRRQSVTSGSGLLGNNMSFTLCSIHILFISNEFHEFWMSFDFRSRCTKNEQIWAKTQADRPGTSKYTALASIQWQCGTMNRPYNEG